ncbi:beta-ribofuranosylaminobenzene 5'-phosphate synthase [candidate division KSB1 bacterium]
MERVTINTPSRLHFGLIDLNGEIGRIDGGIGLALESPHTLIEAVKGDEIRVECADEPEVVERLRTAVETVCKHYSLPGAQVNVLERPLPHVGLGSATQTLVGAAQAVCLLHDIEADSVELAALVGRGGTSGIGVEAIRAGGFIVDGGHRFRCGGKSKTGYTPSGASEDVEPPPVLVRYDFPDWDVLVVVPMGEGASGLREITIFKVVCPIPLEDVRHMCHIILMQMLPAVLERDLPTFGGAMSEFQELGFKVFELRAQTDLLRGCLKFLRDNGGCGTGMSSWGPALFTFGEDLSKLKNNTDEWLQAHGGGKTILTKANNLGMRLLEGREPQ